MKDILHISTWKEGESTDPVSCPISRQLFSASYVQSRHCKYIEASFFLLFHRHRHRWTGVASLFCIVFSSAPRYVPQARIIKKSKEKGREGHAPRQLSSPLAVGVSILQRGLPENGDTLLAPPPGAGAGSKQRIRNLQSGCQVNFNFYCWGLILRQMSCLRDST